MTTTALAKRESGIGGSALLTKEGLDESAEQLALLENYVKRVLRPDQDFGVIPGTNGKPTLLKPGAANIIAAFNCHVDGDDRCALEVMDPDKGAHGFVAYRVVVRIVSNVDGAVRAMGQGSCNSYEAKYRYRTAQPVCPKCGKENIRRSNQGGGPPGFYCWVKTGGCGAHFGHNDPGITSQAIGRMENENPFEQANTILKMAVKRATVDAALQLPGVARFFTQDLDDMTPAPDGDQAAPAAPTNPPRASQAPTRLATPVRPQAPRSEAPAKPLTVLTEQGEPGPCSLHGNAKWYRSKDGTDWLHPHGKDESGRTIWCQHSLLPRGQPIDSTAKVVEGDGLFLPEDKETV